MRGICGVMAGLTLAAWAMPAQAQRGQREPMLSERAFGLGGAVTGSAAGPTAAFYNPAGIADTPGTSAGATLSLRTLRSYTVVDGYNSLLGLQDLTDTGLLSVPIFVGAVLKFGSRDETNIREHGLAAGMLIRHSLDRELLNEDADLMQGIASSLEVFDNQEVRWFYASYAWRPSNQLSFGVTAALSNDDREYREIWTQGQELGEAFAGPEGWLSTRQTRIDTSALSLVFRLGASWRPSDWIQISAMFQIPGIELYDSGSALFQRVTANASMNDTLEDSGFFRVDLDDVDVQATVPWQLRLGAYARFDEALGMALDVGLTGTEGDANNPVHPLGTPVPMDGDRPAATYYGDGYWTDVSFDAAVGAEINLTEEIPLRIGSFLEFSGLQSIRGERDTYSPDRVDRIGVNVGFGVRGDRYDFGIGAGYVYGFGTGLRPVSPFGGGYTTTDVQSHELTFFLSGITGAATQLALDTYREITGHGFSDDEEVPEDAIEQHVADVPELQTEDERIDQLHDQVEHEENLPRWIHDVADESEDMDEALGERLYEVDEDDPADVLLEEIQEDDQNDEAAPAEEEPDEGGSEAP